MAKKKFYSLCRYTDSSDGTVKVGYLLREGVDVPNNMGFDLAVYKATDPTASPGYKEVKTWFVVDTRTGLSVSQADTKSKAVEAALCRLETVDRNKYNEKALEIEKTYGPCPGHGVMYL